MLRMHTSPPPPKLATPSRSPLVDEEMPEKIFHRWLRCSTARGLRSNRAQTLSGTPNVLEYCNNSNIAIAYRILDIGKAVAGV